MKRVLKSHPGILRYEVKTRLEPHAVWLEEEGLTKAGIGKILSRLPQARLEKLSPVRSSGVVHVLRGFYFSNMHDTRTRSHV